MYDNTPDFALNGVLLNPTSSDTALRNCVAEVKARFEAGQLDDVTKAKLVHALTVATERLNG